MSFENPSGTFETGEWSAPPLRILVPTTGQTVQVTTKEPFLFFRPAGTLAALTVKMPITPHRDMIVEFATSQTLTSLTVQDGAGNAITGAPTAGAANTSYEFRYIKPVGVAASWVRWR